MTTYHRPSTFRDTRANATPKVPEVETLRCPSHPNGGTHKLSASRAGRVTCDHCHEPWATLDQGARSER